MPVPLVTAAASVISRGGVLRMSIPPNRLETSELASYTAEAVRLPDVLACLAAKSV